MTKTRQLNIGGETFKVVRSKKYPMTVRRSVVLLSHGYNDIHDAYERPSYYKERIFEDWTRFAEVNGLMNLTILSRNTFQFTLGAIYVSPENQSEQYFIYVTAKKQEAYPIV